jgi:hypothetical protein
VIGVRAGAETLARQPSPPHIPGGLWRYVVLTCGAAGDVVTFKTIAAILIRNQDDSTILTLVVAFTMISLGLMHAAGASARTARDTLRRGLSPWLGAGILFVVWLLLGVAAFYVRLTQPMPSAARAATSAHSSTSTAAATTAMALIFLVLYAGTGTLAAWAAYHQGPHHIVALAAAWRAWRHHRRSLRDAARERRAHRRAKRAAARARHWAWLRQRLATLAAPRAARAGARRRYAAEARVMAAESACQLAAARVELIEAELAHLREQRELDRTAARQQAAEFKHRARRAVALRLGDPASTSALTSIPIPATAGER